MSLIETVKSRNILTKDVQKQVVEALELLESYGKFTRQNSRRLPNYLNKEMQAIVTIMRAFCMKLSDITKSLEERGYEFEADHVDVASRFLAVAVEDFRMNLDKKERAAYERGYSHNEVTIISPNENRFEPECLDDITCNVATDDLYELAELAIEAGCKGCHGKPECRAKDIMLRLRVPPSRDNGKCPYSNAVCEVA